MAGLERTATRFDKARATLLLLGLCAVGAAFTALRASEVRQDGASPWARADSGQAQQFDRPGERP